MGGSLCSEEISLFHLVQGTGRLPGQQKTRVYVPSITVALPVMHVSIDTSIDNIFYAKKNRNITQPWAVR